MENKTIFDSIIDGTIPSYKVYEDELILAILDINPINKGHCLVIPKVSSKNFTDLDEDTYLHAMGVVKKIADKLNDVYNPPKVGVIIEGFEVEHTHIHVFPAFKPSDFRKKPEDKLRLTDEQMNEIKEGIKI